MLYVHLAPYMYLKSFLSSFPEFYSICLHVPLTYKNYKKCSLELSDTFASKDNDKDHVHVLYISHTTVLLKIKGLASPLLYTTQIVDIHSYYDHFVLHIANMTLDIFCKNIFLFSIKFSFILIWKLQNVEKIILFVKFLKSSIFTTLIDTWIYMLILILF
jgi:hypothetical protein